MMKPGHDRLAGYRGCGSGLSLVDVVVVLCLFVVLIGLCFGGCARTKAIARQWQCRGNLKRLGVAFSQYRNEQAGAFPVGIYNDGLKTQTWDRQIGIYVGLAELTADSPTNRGPAGARLFACPDDREPRPDNAVRSYAMPEYDVLRHFWPPTRDSTGGTGLVLGHAQLEWLRRELGRVNPSEVSLNIRMIVAPGNTAELVEHPALRNTLGGDQCACVRDPFEQWSARTMDRWEYHRGKFNYLMIDGSVRLMHERVSGGHSGVGGVWSIRPDD